MTATQDDQFIEMAQYQQPPAAEPDIAPVPDVSGHFVVGAVGVAEEGGASEAPGVAYGGRFAPEALMAALDELAAAYEQARRDPVFRAELDGLLRGYAARPTLLTEARRFGEQAGGCTVLLKREDLTHTGSHKINNVLGQVLLARRMGKTRVIAETGPASTAWPPRPRARCSAWTAPSTWARRTPAGRH